MDPVSTLVYNFFMTDITLTDDELELAEWIGQKRYEQNRARGVIDAGQSGQAALEGLNYAAELAFGKALNLYPDLRFSHPGSVDYRIGEWTIDVKRMSGVMHIRWTDNPSDVYVGVRALERGVFRIMGAVSHEHVLRQERLYNADGSVYYRITNLAPWPRVYAYIQRELPARLLSMGPPDPSTGRVGKSRSDHPAA